MVHQVVVNFATDTFTGWGCVGMNWVGLLEPDYEPVFGYIPTPQHFVGIDPLRYETIERAIKRSKEWKRTDDCIWVDPIGNDLKSPSTIEADCLIGRVIIEKADMKVAMDNLSRYDLLLTGSTWNQERIENATGRDVKVIHEGIDPALFCPGRKSGWSKTFNIFSSGKIEFRKAQDVVLMAFKRFSERHADARLITLWNSPFSDLGNGYKGITEKPIWQGEGGFLNVRRWAHENGIDETKVVELNVIPNPVLPQILREMDVMLAPSRVESCTSLPVKEAMACGVPVIYGRHSGMCDLPEVGIALKAHKPIRASTEYFFPLADWEWYEPNLEEIDEKLEWVYQNRQLSQLNAKQDSLTLQQTRTWAHHVNFLKDWLTSAIGAP